MFQMSDSDPDNFELYAITKTIFYQKVNRKTIAIRPVFMKQPKF